MTLVQPQRGRGSGRCQVHGDARRAELAALYDALWQRDGYAEPLDRELLPALEAERARRVREDAAAVEPTRVDFFTLVRGED